MDMVLGIIGFLGFIFCLIWLIIFAVKKKKKKACLISMAAFFALFIIGVSLPSNNAHDKAAQTAKQSTSKAQSQAVSTDSSKASSQSQTASADSQDGYPVGKDVVINSNSGKYSITIDSVKESKARNEFADSQPKRIIIVNFTYKNISCKEDVTISALYLHVYDSNGKLLETYPSTETKESARISTGKHHSASVAYGIDDSSKQVQIDLYDIFNPLNHAATFQADIK
jgi:hypothetical protein